MGWFFSVDLQIVFLLLLELFLLFFCLFSKSDTDAVHPHDYCYVFNMVHVFDILSLEVGKYFFYPIGQQKSAFFLGISHYETVNMHKRYLGGLELFLIVSQHIQKLNGINW